MHANRGDELMSEKKVDEALKEYAAASRLAPQILELPFWHAVTLASIGREADAAPIFKNVFAKEPVWAELLSRLPAAGLFPNNPALIARIQRLKP
jgi:predicted Zn-dependent protease